MASSKNANYKQLIKYVAVLFTYTLKGISNTKKHLMRIFGGEDPTFISPLFTFVVVVVVVVVVVQLFCLLFICELQSVFSIISLSG